MLISGYFGIKIKAKSLLALYLMCAFYGLLGYLFHLWHEGFHFGRSVLNHTVFIFSHGKWWFINCYLIIYLMSPFLNKAIRTMSKKLYLSCLVLFTILNVYFGFFWGQQNFNQYGYSAAQFVYLYIIGGYGKRFWCIDFIQRNRNKWLGGFLISSALVGIIAVLFHSMGNSPLRAYYYNNPLVLLSAVCFFCFFASINFTSSFINSLASSVLAVYLIQSNEFLGTECFFPAMQNLLSSINPNVGMEWLLLVLISVGFVVCCLCIDKIREFIMTPVFMIYDRLSSKISLPFSLKLDD